METECVAFRKKRANIKRNPERVCTIIDDTLGQPLFDLSHVVAKTWDDRNNALKVCLVTLFWITKNQR